ncbi:unnamed protein product [Schistosoma curassoni]|uniref:Reverse transcriptase domain-containing protein n=1 Tax=Schistosoma curassoni TaxID=6186 RepID=A0A183JZ60_9TREM|nr:unnamed protein product [Schistosoma curassoni]
MNPPDIVAVPTDPSRDVTPPTIEKIRIAIRKMKNGKTVGIDNIPAESLNSDLNVTTIMSHIQEDSGGIISTTDKVENRTPHQDTKERRSEQLIGLRRSDTTIGTMKLLQQRCWIRPPHIEGKHRIQWTTCIQLSGSNLTVQYREQQQMLDTINVSASSIAVGLNINMEKSKVLSSVILDGKSLEKVESFKYLYSMIDKQGGSGMDMQSKVSIPTNEEDLGLKTTVTQHQSQNLQYKREGNSVLRN